MQVERANRAVPDLRDLRVPRGRDLVQSIRPVGDPRTLRTELAEGSRDKVRVVRSGNPDELPSHARRVGQWAQQVERRADAEFAPGCTRVTHRGVKRWGEQERNLTFRQTAVNHRRRGVGRDPQGRKQIGAATTAGHCTVAVFRNRHPTGCEDERRQRGDIER